MQPVEGAVIAAAGLGSRLGLGLPKAMLEIGNKTILSRLIETIEPVVPRIHVVVGYREELVIEHVARWHRNVVIVRNPDYRTTNTAWSMAMGARGIPGKTIFMDGDLVISPDSFAAFVAKAARTDVLVGVTRASSEQAVFVRTRALASTEFEIDEFSRETRGEYEWANVVSGPSNLMDKVSGYVYEQLQPRLPLPAFPLELSEVDTAEDLDRTRAFTQRLSG